MQNKISIDKLFTFLLITFPIIGVYSSGLKGITLADLFLIILYPFLLVKVFKSKNKVVSIFLFTFLFCSILIVLNACVILVINGANNYVLPNTLHFLFYVVTIAIFVKPIFNLRYGLKLLKTVSLFSSLYLIMQYLVHNFTGIYIPGTLPFLEVNSNGIENINYLYQNNHSFRFASLFAEPSHFCIFVLLYLAINLQQKKVNIGSYFPAIIISVAILISRSSTGIIIAILIWFGWLLREFVRNDKKTNKLFFMVIVIFIMPIVIYALLNSQSYEAFIDRTFSSNGLGSATLGRFGNFSFSEYISNNNNFDLFFGKGMIDLTEYVPAIIRIIYFYGFFGFIMFFVCSLVIYKNVSGFQKNVLMIFLMLNIGTEILFGNFILLYIPFIILSEKKKYVYQQFVRAEV